MLTNSSVRSPGLRKASGLLTGDTVSLPSQPSPAKQALSPGIQGAGCLGAGQCGSCQVTRPPRDKSLGCRMEPGSVHRQAAQSHTGRSGTSDTALGPGEPGSGRRPRPQPPRAQPPAETLGTPPLKKTLPSEQENRPALETRPADAVPLLWGDSGHVPEREGSPGGTG